MAMAAEKKLPACPVETTLTLIGDKWKVLIVRDLLSGTKRFGELKKSLGTISQKVLTAQLRQMEDSGLVIRTVYAEVPPRVEYTLTELGYSLKPVLDALGAWGRTIRRKMPKSCGAIIKSMLIDSTLGEYICTKIFVVTISAFKTKHGADSGESALLGQFSFK